MTKYESICKVTDKKETIWLDVIPVKTTSNPNGTILGLVNDCSVHQRTGKSMCNDCNIRKELP